MEKTNKLIKEYIAPILKKYGFKKRKFNWHRKRGCIVDSIKIKQASYSSHEKEIIFFEVAICIPSFIKVIWDKESEFIDVTEGIIRFRLNKILGKDSLEKLQYDSIIVDKNLLDNANEVVVTIENKLIPFLEKNKDYNTVYDNFYSLNRKPYHLEMLYFILLTFYLDKKDEMLIVVEELPLKWKKRALEIINKIENN